METPTAQWSVLQTQLIFLAQFVAFSEQLKVSFDAFYANFKKKFPEKAADVPQPFPTNGEEVDTFAVIFLHIKEILDYPYANLNVYTAFMEMPSHYILHDLISWVSTHREYGKSNKLIRFLHKLTELAYCLSQYKSYVVKIWQAEQAIRQQCIDRHQKFNSHTIEKRFSRDLCKINKLVNLLNQELQYYLPRLIPSPALYNRRDLAKQDMFVLLSCMVMCNKASWMDFQQTLTSNTCLPLMKKKLVPVLFTNHKVNITNLITLYFLCFARHF
jgi:hypothetical protein